MLQTGQYVVVTTDRYSKDMRRISTDMAFFAYLSNVIFDCALAPNGIPAYALADCGVQAKSTHLATPYTVLSVRHLTTTAYRPQTSGQAERINR